MSGVVYYKTKYGATKQYAEWIAEDFGFELKDIGAGARPGSEDVVVIGTSIMMGKLNAREWVGKHWPRIRDKKVVFFVVGGSKIGAKDRDEAVSKSLAEEVLKNSALFHLRGRFDLNKTNFLLSKMIKMAMKSEEDPEVKREWTEGFDAVKKEDLEVIKTYIASLVG